MDKTPVIACSCKHEFQDSVYGKGQRMTTPNNKEQAKKNFVVRCTVCGREHYLGQMK